ncbi:MAG: glycosyltransferase [Patescibacteria group bacterium]
MTKTQKTTISRFNDSDTICVITSYPDSDHGVKELNAVAWHAKKTLGHLSEQKKVIVVAEKFSHTDKIYKDNKNIVVMRLWKRGSPLSLFSILRILKMAPKVEHFLFQFEFNIFGGMLPVLALPLIVLILKLNGKKVHFELHQIILDIRKLAKHINVTHPISQFIFNAALRGFYATISTLSDSIIVLEEELKKRLGQLTNPNKIHIVPISIDIKKCTNKSQAKKSLGFSKNDFVVVVFGFVNWYKGSDWVAEASKHIIDKNIKIVLAGGNNPTLKDKNYYSDYYEKIEADALGSNNLTLTGFVADNDIAKYYSAADLVVMPYRVFMSASGPFSLAISYEKPIILSESLMDYSKSEDFGNSLSYSKLSKKELFFPLKKKLFINKLIDLKSNPQKLQKLICFSKNLAELRSSKNIISRLIFAIYKENLSPLPTIRENKALI